MSTFKNEFSWSISRDRVFQICPRQYYFNYYGYWGGWESNAPQRVKQIYVLKQLKNRYMWSGAKVHDCIERNRQGINEYRLPKHFEENVLGRRGPKSG